MLKAGENRLLRVLLTTSIGNSGYHWFFSTQHLAHAVTLYCLYRGDSKTAAACGRIGWGHNALLLEKLSSPVERIWYARKTIENGWSRNILTLQIENGLFHRQGKAVSNFKKPSHRCNLILHSKCLKDPYVFDFLTIGQKAHERAVEKNWSITLPGSFSNSEQASPL